VPGTPHPLEVAYGARRVRLELPHGVEVVGPRAAPVASPAPGESLDLVARALDEPVDAAPLSEAARGARHVTVVVPDGTRPSATSTVLLPVIARLARAGLTPERIRVIVARGLHAAASRDEVAGLVGQEVLDGLRPVQSAPDLPEFNVPLADDPELGPVRVHRLVAEADLVVLTGAVVPHHLAGFGGGAKALVPGVAERGTILAAHRLTLRTVVAPDGSLKPVTGSLAPNPFRDALERVARAFGRTWLLNVVLDDVALEGSRRVAAAAGGDVVSAHRRAAAAWLARHRGPPPEPADLVIAGCASPRADDLVQAHKALLGALPWARPGAPVIWLAEARRGPGHPDLLPWFEAGRLERHLAALRRAFVPYGLTAYSIRRAASEHPLHVVSEVSPDVTRGMGLLPFPDVQAAVRHALEHHAVRRVAVLPDAE
jgi:lactate racemase